MVQTQKVKYKKNKKSNRCCSKKTKKSKMLILGLKDEKGEFSPPKIIFIFVLEFLCQN